MKFGEIIIFDHDYEVISSSSNGLLKMKFKIQFHCFFFLHVCGVHGKTVLDIDLEPLDIACYAPLYVNCCNHALAPLLPMQYMLCYIYGLFEIFLKMKYFVLGVPIETVAGL